MYYLAKFDIATFDVFKTKKNNLSIKFRIAKWIDHLADEKNFKKFFEKPKKDSKGVKMDISNCKNYTIEVDKKNWELFLKNCNNYKISGNYALNLLIKEYIETDEGYLFVINLKV